MSAMRRHGVGGQWGRAFLPQDKLYQTRTQVCEPAWIALPLLCKTSFPPLTSASSEAMVVQPRWNHYCPANQR